VRATDRLTTSPCCLIREEHDLSTNLERLLRAAGQDVPNARPILEINPGHPLMTRIAAEGDAQRLGDWARILFDQALLSEGGRPEDPAAYVQRVNRMFMALGGGSSGS
jgi:molecular chaperone HtpG